MATKLDGLLTPGGRLVQGSLTVKQDKDFDGRPIAPEDQAYFFALAVPKTDPKVNDLIGQLYQMACADFAQAPAVMQQIQQGLAARDFSWKVSDGDVATIDRKTGQPRPIADYMAGCLIFKFNTKFEVDACDAKGNQIGLGDIKLGDYCDILFNSTTNGQFNDKAGIYLNPTHIRLLGYGAAISTRVSASAAFAGHAAVVPQGASAMPQATGGMPGGAPTPTGMPGAAVPPQTPPGATVPPQTASAGMPGGNPAPQPTASPHTAILSGPGGMPGM